MVEPMENGPITPQEMAEIRRLMLDSAIPGPKTVHAMAGIPGAGKTTFAVRAMGDGRFPKGAFILNPDRVMEALPRYRADYVNWGPQKAFDKWEMPARELAYAMSQEAADRGLPIVKDMGMVRDENWEMLQGFKNRGYAIHLHVISCPLETAMAACAERARFFPLEQIAERAAALEQFLGQYAHIPDSITRYERRDHDFIQLG